MQKPMIIEFTGTPNAGKTTLLKILPEVLATKGINVAVMQEDAEIVPKYIPKKTWIRNVWITLGQIQSLLESKYQQVDIIFLDRGYYDALFWASFLVRQNVCTKEESDSLVRILEEIDIHFNIEPQYLFVFDVSVEESIKRRMAQNRGPISMANAEFLNEYRQELTNFMKKLEVKVEYIDTTNMDVLEMQKYVINKINELCKFKS